MGNENALVRVALGLGSNLGDRESNIATALRGLVGYEQITLIATSNLYQTAPWGKTDQPVFLNACAVIETTLSAHDVLEACLAVERSMGRERTEKWGPRIIDLDVLLYGDDQIKSDTLTVPHPHLTERSFVLVPLADVWPDAVVGGHSIAEHAAPFRSEEGLERFAGHQVLPGAPSLTVS